MEMTCDQAREILWPLEGPRALASGESEARTHLESCAECQLFFERDARLTKALRSGSDAVPAPPELRERIFDALARERTLKGAGQSGSAEPTSTGRWTHLLRVAAALVMILAAALLWLRPETDSRLATPEAYVDDFMQLAALDVTPRDFFDSLAVAHFYMQQLGRRIVPVPLDGASVTRAMICQLEGRRGAMIEYDVDGMRLAHYRIPVERGTETTRPRLSSEMGVHVVRWRDGEYEHALVSELPGDRLVELARLRFARR